MNLRLSFFNLLEVALVRKLRIVLLLNYLLMMNLLLLLLLLYLNLMLLNNRLHRHLAATSWDLSTTCAGSSSGVTTINNMLLPVHLIGLSGRNHIRLIIVSCHYLLHLGLNSKPARSDVTQVNGLSKSLILFFDLVLLVLILLVPKLGHVWHTFDKSIIIIIILTLWIMIFR